MNVRFERGKNMIESEKPKIETIEISEDAKFGKFVVEPLERGYGTTLGNSLRRILLSSLLKCSNRYPNGWRFT